MVTHVRPLTYSYVLLDAVLHCLPVCSADTMRDLEGHVVRAPVDDTSIHGGLLPLTPRTGDTPHVLLCDDEAEDEQRDANDDLHDTHLSAQL